MARASLGADHERGRNRSAAHHGGRGGIRWLALCLLAALPQYVLAVARPAFAAADVGAWHCVMKAVFVLPSDRYMALWARQSRWHSLQLLLAASAPPPKTAILKPAITQKRTIDDSCSFMAEPLLSGLPLFHLR